MGKCNRVFEDTIALIERNVSYINRRRRYGGDVVEAVDKNNVLIISFENNDKLLKLDNYSPPKKIDTNINSNLAKKYYYLYFPKKCGVI